MSILNNRYAVRYSMCIKLWDIVELESYTADETTFEKLPY